MALERLRETAMLAQQQGKTRDWVARATGQTGTWVERHLALQQSTNETSISSDQEELVTADQLRKHYNTAIMARKNAVASSIYALIGIDRPKAVQAMSDLSNF